MRFLSHAVKLNRDSRKEEVIVYMTAVYNDQYAYKKEEEK